MIATFVISSDAIYCNSYDSGYQYSSNYNLFYAQSRVYLTGTTFEYVMSLGEVNTQTESISTKPLYFTTYAGVSYFDNEGFIYPGYSQNYLG